MISLQINHSVRAKFRFLFLIIFVVTGLAVAWLEKARRDETYILMGFIKNKIHTLIRPVRDRTSMVIGDFRSIGNLWKTEEKNHRLGRELNHVRIENQVLQERLNRLERLTGLNRWDGPPELKFMVADVVSVILDSNNASFIINLGRNDGLEPGDPVVALGGLAGVIRTANPHSSHVQAISDLASRVGCVAVQHRVRGVVYGGGRTRPLEFIPENEGLPIGEGDSLITSGFDNSIYPKGIIIGTISGVALNDFGIPYGMVVPAVNPAQIEEVLLIVPENRFYNDMSTTQTLGRFLIQMPVAEMEPGSIRSVSPQHEPPMRNSEVP